LKRLFHHLLALYIPSVRRRFFLKNQALQIF
jgi:hypothetical protein